MSENVIDPKFSSRIHDLDYNTGRVEADIAEVKTDIAEVWTEIRRVQAKIDNTVDVVELKTKQSLMDERNVLLNLLLEKEKQNILLMKEKMSLKKIARAERGILLPVSDYIMYLNHCNHIIYDGY